MMREERIVIPYKPRDAFKPFHSRKSRWALMVAHRRAGKTVATVNDLIKASLTCERQDGRFAYIAPQYNQAKDIAWHYVKRFSLPVPGVQFNESELRIDYPNGSRIRLYGADNPDRMRGLYFDGVVLDEFGSMRESVLSEIIRPALADRQGWAVFIGTPAGKNQFYDLAKLAEASPDWFYAQIRASESGLLPAEELEASRQMMNQDEYDQEYECSFEASIRGSYYGDLMSTARDEGRITSVPVDTSLRVNTAWDLGISDSTAIVFYQQNGREIWIVDYVEDSGHGLDHYARVLDSKGYLYGKHYAPHDIGVRELGTGKSRLEVAANLGIKFEIVPQLGVQSGIDAVRMILNRCWFDKVRTDGLIDCLSNYRREYDEKRRALRVQPLHDWASHGADAFRYLAVSLQDIKAKVEPKAQHVTYKPGGLGWMG
jgi:hypothetical protein